MRKKIVQKSLIIACLCCGLIACSPVNYNTEATNQNSSNNNNSDVWIPDTPAAISLNGNLWDDMQDYLALPDYSYRPEVQRQIGWFEHHQIYLNRVLTRSAPYLYYILKQTKKREIPAELALIPIIESAYNPFKYSVVGANGLWQLMPGTASGKGLKIDWWYDGRRDIYASTNVALDYLAYLNNFFNNNWLLAIAAYNCGEGTVQNAINYNKRHHLPTDYWSLHLPRQTESYVPKLLALSAIIRDPYRYGIKLMPINDAPYLEEVDVDSQIDLSQAAKLAGVSLNTMHKLNPGFRRWATDPDGPYTLLVPKGKAPGFIQRLNALPKNQRVTWQEHTVKPGDTLGAIALKYNTNIHILKQVNHLKSSIIRPKQRLLIPVSFHGSISSPIIKSHATIAEENLPGPNRAIHVVEKGDTLWTVAEKYGVTTRELCFWNSISPKKGLIAGKKLLIWTPSHRHHYYGHTYIYKVMPGDSISVIAERFNSTSRKISHANHLKNNAIRAGQILHIPSGSVHYFVHTVKPGESLKIIAHKFHVTTAKLEKWNHLKKVKYIHPGDKIYIY